MKELLDEIYYTVKDIADENNLSEIDSGYVLQVANKNVPKVFETLCPFVDARDDRYFIRVLVFWCLTQLDTRDARNYNLLKFFKERDFTKALDYFASVEDRWLDAERDSRPSRASSLREPSHDYRGGRDDRRGSRRDDRDDRRNVREPEVNGWSNRKRTSSPTKVINEPLNAAGSFREQNGDEDYNMALNQEDYPHRTKGYDRSAPPTPQQGGSKPVTGATTVIKFITPPEVKNQIEEFKAEEKKRKETKVTSNEIPLTLYQMDKYATKLALGGITLYRHYREEFISLGTPLPEETVTVMMDHLTKLGSIKDFDEFLTIVADLQVLNLEFLVNWLQNRLSADLMVFCERNYNLIPDSGTLPIIGYPEKISDWLKKNEVLVPVKEKALFVIRTLFSQASYTKVFRPDSNTQNQTSTVPILCLRYSVPIILLSSATTWVASKKSLRIDDRKPCVKNDLLLPLIGSIFERLDEPYDDELIILDRTLQPYKTNRLANVTDDFLGTYNYQIERTVI